MSDLVADDLLLNRLAGRVDAGSEPVAGLLGALAAHADTPLPSRTGRRRIANKHRYLGAFAALAVAASGAGVAAAVTLPANGPSQAERARIIQKMEESARGDAPSALLSRLGLPQTSGTTQAKGLVLARGRDGTIVLLPAAVVAAQRRAAAAGTNGMPGVVAGAQDGGRAATGRAGNPQNGNPQNGKPSTGNGPTGDDPAGNATTGNGQGGTAVGRNPTGTPSATNNGKKPPAVVKGGKKNTTAPTAATERVVPEATLAPAATPGARPTAPGRPRATGGAEGTGSPTT